MHLAATQDRHRKRTLLRQLLDDLLVDVWQHANGWAVERLGGSWVVVDEVNNVRISGLYDYDSPFTAMLAADERIAAEPVAHEDLGIDGPTYGSF